MLNDFEVYLLISNFGKYVDFRQNFGNKIMGVNNGCLIDQLVGLKV